MERKPLKQNLKPEVVQDHQHQHLVDSSVVFPFGKYKDQQVQAVVRDNKNYCLWWVHNIVTNSVAVGRVKDVIAKELLPKPQVSSSSYRPSFSSSEEYCDYNDDLMEVYDFAMYDGGGAPFLI